MLVNTTKFALELIKSYNSEFNRMRRAKAAAKRILTNDFYLIEMEKLNLVTHLAKAPGSVEEREYQKRNFITKNPAYDEPRIFTSKAAKQCEIRKRTKMMRFFNDNRAERHYLEEYKSRSVRSDLGGVWAEYVQALWDYNHAYKLRFEARCAIKAFNKLKTGIEIRFGNCRRGGGSMSYINHVLVDGDKVPLSKFLDNAEFEVVVLNG
jgi:hypothetical protein